MVKSIEEKSTIRISEAAKMLGVNPMTLRRWEQAGLITPLRMSRRGDRRYTKEQILKILNEGFK